MQMQASAKISTVLFIRRRVSGASSHMIVLEYTQFVPNPFQIISGIVSTILQISGT